MPILALRDATGRMACIIAPPGESMAQAVWLSGLARPQAMCAGLGLCGKCQLRYVSPAPEPTAKDRKFFSATQLGEGWRLGCQHKVPENNPLEVSMLEVEIPQPFRELTENPPSGAEASGKEIYLGIDLGTTSVAWRGISKDGVVGGGEMPNPQAAAGADVISRLQFAQEPENRNRLANLAREAINGIIAGFVCQGINTRRACLAANPAMTQILLEKDLAGLCASPYRLAFKGGEILPFPPGNEAVETVFPPLFSPFVGGDTSCALLSLLACNTPAPFFLADLGTNAELALFIDEERLFVASLPLGPALEGIGPACGQCAAPGVASSFRLGPEGVTAVYLPGLPPNGGICATGYLALIRILRSVGLIDPAGHFACASEGLTPLARRIYAGLDLSGPEKRLQITDQLYLLESDIEQLLKVRAALSVGVASLLQAAKLSPSDIACWKIAGATGAFATSADLETLGLPGESSKLQAIGNAALDGACLLAREPEKLDFLATLCKRATLVELVGQSGFSSAWLEAMQWP